MGRNGKRKCFNLLILLFKGKSENPRVGGSIPSPATSDIKDLAKRPSHKTDPGGG
jgi:hypothetical protein